MRNKKYIFEGHSINKGNIAEEVDNRKHCQQFHIFKVMGLSWPRRLSASLYLLTATPGTFSLPEIVFLTQGSSRQTDV